MCIRTIFLSQSEPQNQMPFERELFELSQSCGEIILLLYSWNGDVISTGKLQKRLKINREKCERDGVKVVERISGGRAVFHSNDICYSLSIPQKYVKKTGKNLNEAICEISKPIIKTLAEFKIFTDGNSLQRRNLHSDFCAETQSVGEISVGKKKLVANSQIYSAQGILQHGTIPVSFAYRRIYDYIEGDAAHGKKYLEENTTCLNEISPQLKAQDFMKSLAKNFADWGTGITGN